MQQYCALNCIMHVKTSESSWKCKDIQIHKGSFWSSDSVHDDIQLCNTVWKSVFYIFHKSVNILLYPVTSNYYMHIKPKQKL